MSRSKYKLSLQQRVLFFLSFGVGFCLAQVSLYASKEGSFVYGNFLKAVNGSVLQRSGSLLSKTEEDNETDCKQRCVMNPTCLSVNFGINPNKPGKVQCELFSYGRSDYQDHLVNKSGFFYARMKTYCITIPCPNVTACNPVLGNPARLHSCVCRNSDNANVLKCDSGDIKCNALGMEDGRILNSQITSSGDFGGYPSTLGRLNYGGSWIPSPMANSWIVIDLLKSTTIFAVATQGSYYDTDEFITTYQIHYRLIDSAALTIYKEDGVEKTLTGNSNKADVVKLELKEPFVAKAVRFVPKTWGTAAHPGWRVELYGRYN